LGQVQAADRPIIVVFQALEHEGEVHPTFQLAQPLRLLFHQLQQEEFTGLQCRMLRTEADGEHRLLNALVHLGFAHV
jgi:hypothetical protein